MKANIVDTPHPTTLIGGGEAHVEDVETALTLAPACVAVDGGAALALEAGSIPTAVIGDFDSISDDVLAQLPAERLHKIAEQDTTDFDKALRSVKTPLSIGVGFTGARVDHQLATLHVLARYPDRPCVLLGRTELIFLCPRRINLELQPGAVVSLFPLGPVSGTSQGLRWPIDGLAFDPIGQIGTSNFAEGPVALSFDAPCMIAIVPRSALAEVTQALLHLPATDRWPARA